MQCLRDSVLNYGGLINGTMVQEFEPGNNGMIATHDIENGSIVYIVP